MGRWVDAAVWRGVQGTLSIVALCAQILVLVSLGLAVRVVMNRVGTQGVNWFLLCTRVWLRFVKAGSATRK